MKKHLPTITILTIIIGVIALGIWYSDKDSPLKQLAKLDVYSKEELSFLEEEGFLNNIDSENLPNNKEQIISLLKSPNLIEQNLNSPDESFEVLATKLGENTYQLAFKLENKSNQSKEFYLIPISESSQTEFKEIRGRISGSIIEVHNTPLVELYDVNQHKSELRPELAQAYDDIDNNGYTGKPIKLVLEPNSILIAQSKWEITRGQSSDSLEPIYLLVYGSSGGAMDELYKDISFEQLDKVEKEIGIYRITYDEYSDVEIKDQDMPEVKLRKWGDETYIKVSYPDFTPVNPKQNNGKMKWINGNKEVHLYPIEKTEDLPEGFEFEIILLEKPTTNKIVLSIESKGLKFYYQPALNIEEKDNPEVDFCSETTCYKDGEIMIFRPENVVGSYAVYHQTKGGMNDINGKDYKVGKAFHIYRPKIIDADGWEAWGELNIANGKMTVTIPQDFVDNAIYPIRHAAGATFGTDPEIPGGTATNIAKGFLLGWRPHAPAGAGTVTSIHIYMDTNGSQKVKHAIYKDSDDSLTGYTVEYNGDSGEVWLTMDIVSGGSITAVNYIITTWTELYTATYYYDSGPGCRAYRYYVYTGTYPDPAGWGGTTDCGKRFSGYATYTPAPPSVGIKGGFRVKGGLKIKF